MTDRRESASCASLFPWPALPEARDRSGLLALFVDRRQLVVERYSLLGALRRGRGAKDWHVRHGAVRSGADIFVES